MIDPRTGELLDLDLPYDAIDFPFIAAEGQTIAFVGGKRRRRRRRWSCSTSWLGRSTC